jgi:hypothetical protein
MKDESVRGDEDLDGNVLPTEMFFYFIMNQENER